MPPEYLKNIEEKIQFETENHTKSQEKQLKKK